ncbi:MAG: RagB/SusD family nutrient uptake outer membrane protein [Paraprevotella sp.]|nr:RagB/SusD family nutrient uptake outer membrane protein [Paraprevotella sp.]
MKRNRWIGIWMMVFPLLLMSCENYLDITPDGQRKRDQLLSTSEGIEDALYGVYATLRDASLYGTELSFSSIEIMAQYLECPGNDEVSALLQYRYSDTRVQSVFEGVWTKMYNNISNVNSVLTCDLVKNATEYPYSIYRGEALGLRALMHFDLLRLFTEQITQNPSASGIPYATEFSLHTPDFISAAEVYDRIIADLLEAETLLADEDQYKNTTSFMTDRQIHFNLYAVQATLDRVYLTKGDKENALKYALKVINNSGYSLSDKTEVNGDLAGILSTKETIFGVYYANFYSVVSPLLQKTTSFSSLDPRSDIMDFYDADVTGLDYRASAYFTATSDGSAAAYRLSKLTDVYELQNIASKLPSDKILGINMIRMPEMYYIAAECLLDKDYDEAVRLFNEVLTHRGLEELSNWPAPPNKLTQDAINAERYREFIGEGQTFFNMKRQNLSISSVDGKTVIKPSNKVYVVPIPDIEYDYRK